MCLPSDKPRGLAESVSAMGWFLLHNCVSMGIGPMVVVLASAIASYVFRNAPSSLKSAVEEMGLANPFIWIPAIALGFLVNRRTHMRMACWVWCFGVVWLAVGIWGSIRYYDGGSYGGCSALENVVNAFVVLNARRCGGGESTLQGLFFTMPALSSAAYAVGAWVALRFGQTPVVRLPPDLPSSNEVRRG